MKKKEKTSVWISIFAICLFVFAAVGSGCGNKHGDAASSGEAGDPAAYAAVDGQGAGISLADLATGEPPVPELSNGPRDAYAAIVGVPPLGAAGGPSYSAYYKPVNAFDGNPASWWVGQSGAGSWDLYYGLATAITFTQININFYSALYTPGDVKLYTSMDGTTWALTSQITSPSSKPSFAPSSVTAKYIRIQMTGNPPAGFPLIREIDCQPASFKTGATAGPNFSDDWYFASNAFDSNPNTWWVGAVSAGAWDVYYNFGAPRSIGLVTAAFYSQSTRPATTTLYTSSDGVTWVKTGDFSADATATVFSGTSTQYIKISMTGNPPSSFPIIKDIYFNATSGAASSDSYSSSFLPASAFDNNPATHWAGKKNATEWNMYYTYSSSVSLKNITVHYTDLAHTPATTTLYTSNDGVAWSNTATLSKGADAKTWANVTAKYLRFQLSTATASASFFPTIKDINIGGPMVSHTRIAGGYSRTCALTNYGAVKCWGRSLLGNGSNTDSASPVSVSGITNAISVTSADDYACALLATGGVKCWGMTASYLGSGATTTSYTPVIVSGITNATTIDGGGAHACAVLSGGSVKCWGYNNFGELGNGTNTAALVPVFVSGVTNAVAVTAAWHHSCALLSTGSVKCWGSNGSGQLGNGTTVDSNLPVTVTGITDAVSITAADAHTCAVVSNGAVKCWGSNYGGNLGNGGTTASNTPVTAAGLLNVINIAAGGSNSCAVITGGSVKCWGYNSYGGIGSVTGANPSPLLMSSIASASETTAGFSHSCYLLDNGSLKCMGDNCNGDLGGGAGLGLSCGTNSSPVTVVNYP